MTGKIWPYKPTVSTLQQVALYVPILLPVNYVPSNAAPSLSGTKDMLLLRDRIHADIILYTSCIAAMYSLALTKARRNGLTA